MKTKFLMVALWLLIAARMFGAAGDPVYFGDKATVSSLHSTTNYVVAVMGSSSNAAIRRISPTDLLASMTNLASWPNRGYFTNVIRTTPADGPNMKTITEAAPSRTLVELGSGDYLISSNQIQFPEGVWWKGQGKGITVVKCPWAIDVATGSGSFCQFLFNANNGVRDLTTDMIAKTNAALYQQPFGEVPNSQTWAATNLWLVNVEVLSFADCFVWNQGLDTEWHVSGCRFYSAFAGFSMQSPRTNSYFYIDNTEFVADGDTSKHAVNTSLTLLSMNNGYTWLRNCSFKVSGATNVFMISPGTSTGTGAVYISGCTFESDHIEGFDYHLYKNTPNTHFYVDNPLSIDFTKVGGAAGGIDNWPGKTVMMANSLYLGQSGVYNPGVNETLAGLFFAEGGPTNASNAQMPWVLSAVDPENNIFSCPGGFCITTNGSSTNTTVWFKSAGSGCDFDGWVSLAAAGSGSGGSGGPSTNSPPYAITGGGAGGTNLFVDFRALGSTNDITYTIGTSNIAVVATNVVAGKVVRLAIAQPSAGFATCTTNSSYPNSIRIGTTVTGFNLSTNGNWIDLISMYGVGTNALLVGNLLGFAP